MILGLSVTSCSSLYEELQVTEKAAKEVTVKEARISGSGGSRTLSFTTSDGIVTTSAVSVNGAETAITGTVTDNGDGTRTVTFDVSEVITDSTKGGTIRVTVKADGFRETTITADYTPDVKLTVPESRNIFNSDSIFEDEPLAETNYHDSITVTKVYTASDGTRIPDWEAAKAFMADPANSGKTLTVTFTATADKDSTKTATSATVFTVRKDVPIDSVEVVGTAKVGETLIATPYFLDDENGNAKTEYEGQNVTYQWYVADSASGDGTAIEGATEKTYTVTAGNAGKYIYVKAVQTNRATGEKTIKDSAHSEQVAKGSLNLSAFNVTYPAALTSGNSPSLAGLSVTGTLTGGANNAVIERSANDGSDGGYTLSVSGTALTSSGNVTVTISAAGYEDITKEVFVTVKLTAPAAPSLSTNVSDIPTGNIRFEAADSALEYSTDGGATWHEVTTDDFTKPASLYVRKKATGTEEQAGYIAPSDNVEVAVAEENVGTKVSAKTAGIVISAWGDIGITKNGNTLTAAEGYTDYAWEVDGVAAPTAGFTADGKTLTITTTPGTYGITVSAVRNGVTYSAGVSVKVE